MTMTSSGSDELSPGDWNYPPDSDDDNDDTLSANTSLLTSWSIVIVAFLVGGLGSVFAIPSSNFLSFLFFGCIVASPFWILFTESGAEWYRKEVMNSNSSQTQNTDTTTSSDNTIICMSCGWQNGQENNFCHDCGVALDDSSAEVEAAKADSTDGA